MLKRLRTAGLLLLVASAIAAPSQVAHADGWGVVDCSQHPSPGCQLSAGTSGVQPPSVTPGGGERRVGDSPGPGGSSSDPDPGRWRCSYVRSDYQPPASGGVVAAVFTARPLAASGGVVAAVFTARPLSAPGSAAPTASPKGAWYVYKCTGKGAADAIYRPPVFIADAPAAPGPVLPDPAALARQAYDQLRLPPPAIRLSPARRQLVNLPTWLWVDRAGWGAASATAAVPGESVTATAAPTSVTWSLGDGSTVTCTGSGTPYSVGVNPASVSPDCGHTYRRSSAGQPGAAYAVTATVHWSVTWAGAGQAGTFAGLTTTATVNVPVAESQALTSN